MEVPPAQAIEAAQAPPPRRPRRWRFAAAVVALLVLGALLARRPATAPASQGGSSPSRSGSSPSGGAKSTRPPPPLPNAIAFVSGGLSGGPGPQLYVGRGSGLGAGTSPSGRRAAVFAWSSDGVLAVVDVGGRVRLVPGGTTVAAPGPTAEVAFSPNGRYLATCGGRPTSVSVFRVADPARPIRAGVLGCSPTWSPDGRYVAFRIPDLRVPGGFDTGRIGMLDVSDGGWRTVRAGWPFAWLPGGPDRLSAAAPDGTLVEVDPRGGHRRTVASAATLRALAGHPDAPTAVRLLAWSPDGAWLAVGFGPVGLNDGSLAILAPGDLGGPPPAGRGPRAYAMPVRASWSIGDQLLVEFDSDGGAYSEVFTPRGGASYLGLVSASWSPDGQWVLGETPHGWVAVQPGARMPARPISDGAQWSSAAWCCPPVPVDQVTG